MMSALFFVAASESHCTPRKSSTKSGHAMSIDLADAANMHAVGDWCTYRGADTPRGSTLSARGMRGSRLKSSQTQNPRAQTVRTPTKSDHASWSNPYKVFWPVTSRFFVCLLPSVSFLVFSPVLLRSGVGLPGMVLIFSICF